MSQPTEQEFIQKISELKETGILQGGYLAEEQIEEVFPALTQEQRSLLLDYFKENKIGIGEALPDTEILTEEQQSHFHMYLEELEEMETVDNDLRRVLIMNALNGDQTAKERLTN